MKPTWDTVPIIISDHAMQGIITAAEREGATFRQTGRRNPDGTWTVPVSLDTIERLAHLSMPGETVNDTIERALFLLAKGSPS